MPIEQGILEYYENQKREQGQVQAAEQASFLREQFGDEPFPLSLPVSTPPIYSPIEFVKAALLEGAHLTRPKHRGLSEDGWIRSRNILGSYLIAGITQTKIAEVYGLSPSNLSVTIKRTLVNLWENSSSNLQAKFLPDNRPNSHTPTEPETPTSNPQTKGLGQKAIHLIDMLNQGMDIRQIVQDLNISTGSLAQYRSSLAERGIIIPRRQKGPKNFQQLKPRSRLPAILPEDKPIHPELKEALRDVNLTFIDPRSREFLKLAFIEGAHLTRPPRMSPERWVEKRNIFGTYILSQANFTQVGRIYGISRELVRLISAEVFARIWTNSSPDLQAQFPYIVLDKAMAYRSKEWLLLKGNLGSRIVEMLEQGQTPDQIRLQFPSPQPRQKATAVLKMLREMGFDIQRMKNINTENPKIGQELQRTDLSDQEVQQLLDQIVRGNDFSEKKLGDSITMIKALLKAAGFHYKIDRDAQLFYNALAEAGIPMAKVENVVKNGPQKGTRFYYIIASQHIDRAVTALKANPNLVKFLEDPVKQISGPKTDTPTTTLLRNGTFKSVGTILKQLRIGGRRYGKLVSSGQFDQILTNCPIPIFYYKTDNRIYFKTELKQELKEFIERKLADLK